MEVQEKGGVDHAIYKMYFLAQAKDSASVEFITLIYDTVKRRYRSVTNQLESKRSCSDLICGIRSHCHVFREAESTAASR